MANTSGMAAQSVWFQRYEQEVNGAKKAAAGKKKVLIIIPIMLFAIMFVMIKNGALENDQTKGGVFFMGALGAVMLLMIIILTSKAKNGDAATVTRKDLDTLLQSAQDVAEFDAQMQGNPLFQLENGPDEFIFATKDFIGTRFKFMGDTTWRFIRIRDIAVLHTVHGNSNNTDHCDVEFRDRNNQVLLTWVAKNEKKVEELKVLLQGLNLNLNAFR